MTDWQRGDLSVCVDFSPNASGEKPPLNEDKIYEVDDVVHPGDIRGDKRAECLSLKVAGKWYVASRFRKVRHDSARACKRSFAKRLKRVSA